VVEKVAVVSMQKIIRTLAGFPDGGNINENYRKQFLTAINNDLNTAEGLALIYKILDDSNLVPADKLSTILDFDKVLGLDLANGRLTFLKIATTIIPDSVYKLLALRDSARIAKDWKKSDELRDQIQNQGFRILDSEAGSVLEPI